MTPDDKATYTGPTIPQSLGDGLRTALGLDARPRTFGEYVDAMARFVDREGLEVDLDTLCTTDASPHRARFRGRIQYYHCTLDAIIVPFLAGDIDHVEVETESPLSGDRITYTITDDDITSDPEEAVLSFGVASDLDPPGESRSPALAYRRICPYGKAFRSPAEYKRWASETDAHTMLLSMEDGLALARALGSIG